MDHMDSMVSKLQQRPVPYRGCLGTCKACGRHPKVRPCALNAGHDQTYCICEKCIRGGRPSPSRTGRIDMDNMDSMVLQALDMGLVGKPERIDRSWAIVPFQTGADEKAFIENNLEWLPMATSLWRKKFGPHNGSATMASARCRSVNAFSFRRITKRNNGDDQHNAEELEKTRQWS